MEESASNADTRAALSERVRAFAQQAKQATGHWRKAAAIAGRMQTEADLEDLAAVRKAAAALGRLGPPEAQAVAAELTTYAEQAEEQRRFGLIRDLVDAFRQAGVEAQSTGGEPPTFRVGLAVVTLDLGRDKAMISYARHPIAETSLAPAKIVEAWSAATGKLEQEAPAPDDFRTTLLGAYRAFLARHGRTLGERVDAVDLLAEMAVAVQGKRFRADPRAKLFTDYGRARFAYDLAALVGQGLLSREGYRLEMGPATLGATGNKRRVLWLEVGPGGGQYYGSLRFVAETAGSHDHVSGGPPDVQGKRV